MSKFKPGQTVFQIFGEDIVKRVIASVITFEDTKKKTFAYTWKGHSNENPHFFDNLAFEHGEPIYSTKQEAKNALLKQQLKIMDKIKKL